MDIDQYKQAMREQALLDKEKMQTQITAKNLHEALRQASIELSIPIKKISYEILQRSRKGLFGVGGRDCIVIAYELEEIKKIEGGFIQQELDTNISDENLISNNEDGKISVRCLSEKVFIRVKSPRGNGNEADFSQVKYILRRRGISKVDDALINLALSEKNEEEILIGTYLINTSGDAEMSIRFSDDEMSAFLLIIEPSPGGADITENDLLSYMDDVGIEKRYDDEALSEIINYPSYGKDVKIAEGQKVVNGLDARVEYLFETDRTKLLPKEVDGRIDFKSMNFIQNVEEGEILARKIPPTEGVSGFTVKGAVLISKDGSDIKLLPGDNVLLSEDQNSIISEINGQVLLADSGKISVSPIFVVEGDVNTKTSGNIDFIGAVVIKGNIEDGYEVTASKNIEINGTVGKSKIISGGDIVIAQGIAGKEEGSVFCAGNLFAKFIGNAHVTCKGDVIVKDGIVNANVDSDSSILCSEGKRASIIGGHLRASKKVVAKTIGSSSGVTTIIEVGFEPEKRQRFLDLDHNLSLMRKEVEEIDLNLSTFQTNVRDGLKITPERVGHIKSLKTKKDELMETINSLMIEFTSIKEYLESLKMSGSISVEGRIYPGVRINISGVELRIKQESHSTTFYRDGPVIRMKAYEEVKDGD